MASLAKQGYWWLKLDPKPGTVGESPRQSQIPEMTLIPEPGGTASGPGRGPAETSSQECHGFGVLGFSIIS